MVPWGATNRFLSRGVTRPDLNFIRILPALHQEQIGKEQGRNGKSYGGLWHGGYRHGDITYSQDVSGSATEFGSRLNVGLEGRDEKENPTFLTSTAEEKAVTFETPGEKVIWGKHFN